MEAPICQRLPLDTMLFARPSLTMRALRAAQAPRYVRAFGTSIPVRSEDLSTPEAKQNRIISILTEKFTPEDLQVQDISGTHRS